MCFYCGDDLNTHERLRKHTKGHGRCTDKDRAIRLVKSAEIEIKIDVSDITCEICTETFPYLDDIINHLIFKHHLPYDKDVETMISAYRLTDLQCLLCDKSFNYLRKLITHMNIEHPNNCFLCPECKQKFNKKRDLDAHVRIHHKKCYSCLKCDQTFPSHSALQIHRSNAHASTCNICFQIFSSESKRLSHLKLEHESDSNECGFCNKILTTKQAFLRHASKCKPNAKEETIIVNDEDKKISVKEIRKSLAYIFNMTTALPFKFYMNRFRCFYCAKDFTLCEDLKEHTVLEHPHCDISFKSMKLRNRYDGVQIKIDTSSLSCRLCLVSLQDLNDLIDHLSKEHKAKCHTSVESNMQSFKLIKDNYPCPICGEVYRYFGVLLKHVSSDHNDNKHICMYCGKAFRTDPNLRAHVSRRHKTADKYKCSNCDLFFRTKNALRNHQGGVHGNKQVQCSECTEKFISQYTMQRHMITSHDGLPGPYEGCTSERRRKNLKILFNHTTIMPFKWRGKYLCFYCGKNYTEYTEFRKHTKSHGLCTTKDYSLKLIKGNNVEIKIDVSEIGCDICNEPFTRFEEIIDHLISKHNMEYNKDIDIPFQEYRLVDFRCLYCAEQFSYFGYLVKHVNNVHPQNCFICDDCGVTFNKKRDLSVHLRNYHRLGGYPCDLCLKNFETQLMLRRHQNNMHFRQCKCCSLRFASLSLLQKHVLVDHPQNEGNMKCSYCSKEFHTSLGLRQHISKCKVKIISQVEPTSFVNDNNVEPKKKQNILQIRQNIQCVLNMSTAVPFKFFSKYSCFYCSKKFVEFDELRHHTSLEHPVCDLKSKCMKKCKGERIAVKIDISTLACKICCLPMPNLEDLISHLIGEHKANYDVSISGCLDPFRVIKDNMPCPICPDTVFRYFGNLLRHMNSEHSNNNRICDFCGRSFRNAANLSVHITYAHTGSCECDICGVKCKNQWCLARHRARTHNAKDHKCPKCPEQFQSQYHKQKHLIKMHNIGHKCSYCGKMFTRNSFMKDHVRRTHLKEKNIPCSICNEKFFDNYLLRMHMVKHEGDRKFTCTVCGKAFLRRSNLSSHMEMHKKYGHVQLQI